jgi:hypothetical protein
MINDNRLYLAGLNYLKIFELTTSLTQPLTPVTEITTKYWVFKILRMGHYLLLGEDGGLLEVVDISSSTITSAQ